MQKSPAQLIAIPLDLVEPYPRLLLRFVYEVVSLAALIRAAIDENAPNGQLNPGRVVPRKDGKKGYLVYVGVRRYLALKWLCEKTHDPRFAVFNAYVDTGLTELQMFVRAKMENEDEKGERQGLSVLEEVFGLFKIRDSVSFPEKLEGELKREFAVAGKINEERAERLFRVESATHFRFRLAHLERLCAIQDDREFYLSAACAAGFGMGADRMDEAVERRDSAYLLEWFRRLFPEFKEPQKAPSPATGSEKGEGGQATDKQGDQSKKKRLEVRKKAGIILECPACATEKVILLELKVLVREIPLDPTKTGKRGIPDSVLRYPCSCDGCPKEFYAFVEPLGGRKYAAEASVSRTFREPKEVVEAVDIRADFEENVWQKVVEGKVIGTVGGPRHPVAAGKE